MGKTLGEQMLALGLVDKKKVKENRKAQHKQKKQKAKSKVSVADENLLMAREAEEKKRARAQELNAQREEKLKKRADAARIRQLVERHGLPFDEKGVAYRFNDGGKIRRIFVPKETADGLSSGRLGVVGAPENYAVVPRDVVARIQEIDKDFFTMVVALEDKGTEENDPYAGFEVPDDLMW